MDRRAFSRPLPCPAWRLRRRTRPRQAPANDAQFTIEARFYEKLPYKKIKCKLCPANVSSTTMSALLRRPRKPRRHLLLPGLLPRLFRPRRPHRKETFVPFRPRHHGLLHSHRRLQRQLQDVPELGDLAVPPRTVESAYLPPKSVPALAQRNNCYSIAYTYSEPVVFPSTSWIPPRPAALPA